MSPAAWPVKLVPFSALRVWATLAGRVQPADNGDVEDVGGAQRRGGGGRMVGMAGDARGVEDHERLRRHRTRRGKHVSDHDRHPDVAQRAVGVVEQPRPPCAEHPRRLGQLTLADRSQVPVDPVQRGRLTMRQAQDTDLGALTNHGCQHGTQPEGLVVGMRHDGEDPVPARQPRGGTRTSGRGSRLGAVGRTFMTILLPSTTPNIYPLGYIGRCGRRTGRHSGRLVKPR